MLRRLPATAGTGAFRGCGDQGVPVPAGRETVWPGWNRCAGDRRFNVRTAGPVEIRQALAICQECPDRLACLDFVINRGGLLGPSLGGRYTWRIWGGVLPDQMRRRLRSRWGESMRPPTLDRSRWDDVDDGYGRPDVSS